MYAHIDIFNTKKITIKEFFQEMLASQSIQLGMSDFSSSILLTQKNGKWHLCMLIY